MPVLIRPDWPAPAGIRAVSTTRLGGASLGPYTGLNLGARVGDAPERVAENRALLARALALPRAPVWLRQQHGDRVIDPAASDADPSADGACTAAPGVACVVLTADCLPVLLCEREGRRVAALHGGWRGLAAGILARGVAVMQSPPGALLAWLGPAIGPRAYEVGEEVYRAFGALGVDLDAVFERTRPGHWHCDLYAAARGLLQRLGVGAVYGGGECTFSDPQRYYSHRREQPTGRMATLIWRS
ncbi:MAG: peptidoglycan editing factor PgeF [Gammaproteobacteria bacterium]